MHLCKKCHGRDEKRYDCAWDLHIFRSRGPCEGCDNTAVCVECEAHKRKHPTGRAA